MTAGSDLDRLFARTLSVPLHENREQLRQYVYEETQRVKISTLNARLDAVIQLGIKLGQRRWKEAGRLDIIATIADHRIRKGRARTNERLPGRPLAPTTRFQWKVHLSVFLKHVWETDETPDCCKRLPFAKKASTGRRIREMALQPREVAQLMRGARNSRDRALIASAIETGFRASEIAALRFDGMERRTHGVWFQLDESEPKLKTGPREAPVPIISGLSIFDEWLADHPRASSAAGPIFVTLSNRSYGRRMTGKTISEAISRCAKRAGLRHISSHFLRHTSATLKVAKGMHPEAIRITHGWTTLQMMSVYVAALPHYEKLVLDVHGLEAEEPALLDILGSLPCMLCGSKLLVGAPQCSGCGASTAQAVQESTAKKRSTGAVDFVAIELSAALGWSPPETGQENAAREFLMAAYREAGGGDNDEAFARWCLRQWASKCRAG